MKQLPNLFGRASAVEADHEHLRSSWARLQELAAGSRGTSSSEEAWTLVREFANELRAHFAAEEEGYFDALLAEQPDLQTRIEQLRGDHRVIAGLFEELMALEMRPGPSGEFEPRLSVVLVRLQRHEHAERGLLQEFFARADGGES